MYVQSQMKQRGYLCDSIDNCGHLTFECERRTTKFSRFVRKLVVRFTLISLPIAATFKLPFASARSFVRSFVTFNSCRSHDTTFRLMTYIDVVQCDRVHRVHCLYNNNVLKMCVENENYPFVLSTRSTLRYTIASACSAENATSVVINVVVAIHSPRTIDNLFSNFRHRRLHLWPISVVLKNEKKKRKNNSNPISRGDKWHTISRNNKKLLAK